MCKFNSCITLISYFNKKHRTLLSNVFFVCFFTCKYMYLVWDGSVQSKHAKYKITMFIFRNIINLRPLSYRCIQSFLNQSRRSFLWIGKPLESSNRLLCLLKESFDPPFQVCHSSKVSFLWVVAGATASTWASSSSLWGCRSRCLGGGLCGGLSGGGRGSPVLSCHGYRSGIAGADLSTHAWLIYVATQVSIFL